MLDKDKFYMNKALEQAQQAFDILEVPIGAVIVYNDQIIGMGFNQRNSDKNPLSHAEIKAIDQAAHYINDWRLEDCTMYITLEPCPMCAGAIVQSRIKRVVIGAMNLKAGCAGSIMNILQEKRFNHQCEVVTGVLEAESSQMLKDFFRQLRKK